MRLLFMLFLLLIGLTDAAAKPEATKRIYTGAFSIELPRGWKYVRQFGTDSFVGEFRGDGVGLSFDYSEDGYSWMLPQSLDDYLYGRGRSRPEWVDICAFCEKEENSLYTTNVEATKAEKLKEVGPVEFAKWKIKPFPKDDFTIEVKSDFDKSLHPNADYLGILTRPNGAKKEIGIQVPDDTKYTRTTWRETDRFVIGTAVSTLAYKGITGIYFREKNSRFTFVLGTNDGISEELKVKLLESFKTIKFSRHNIGD